MAELGTVSSIFTATKRTAFHSSLHAHSFHTVKNYIVLHLWLTIIFFCYTILELSWLKKIACLIFPELFYDRGNHHEFTSLVRDLARPGELMQSATYDFEFVNVEKPYETYTGANVRLR